LLLGSPPLIFTLCENKESINEGSDAVTKLLEKAFEEASRLPEMEQNALAKWLLDELHSEAEWDRAFAESEDILEKLADEALEEKRKGKTTPLDPDQL
jgi:uncharacterized protein with von Willebrand factor type A (vWA) domain